MKYLSVEPYSIKRFFHDSAKKLLIGEASSLGLFGFSRLYDDACDLGLALYNPNTNSTSYWYLFETNMNEGEVQYWDLKPCNPKDDVQSRYIVRIFND